MEFVGWVFNPTTKTAGGSPAASHFFLLRQRKSNQKEGDPGLPPPSGVPPIRRKRTGLRNSHDPLRGHVLKQCSPNPTARLCLIEAALRGWKSKKPKP